MGSTLVSLILGNPDVDFVFESNFDGEETTLDTRMIKAELDDTIALTDPAVLNLIQNICKGDRGKGTATDGGEKNG
jgi:hypothetical protein